MRSTLATLGRSAWSYVCVKPAPEGGPAFFDQRRAAAVAWAAEHGYPTKKDEDWRYFPHELLGAVVPIAAVADATAGELTRLGDERVGDGPLLVFLNGRFLHEQSSIPALPEGVRVSSLADALLDAEEPLRRAVVGGASPYRHAFAALNAAHAVDGAFVDIAPGCALEQPIEIVYVTTAPGATGAAGTSLAMSSTLSLVRAGAGSRCSLLERYVGSGERPHLTSARTECFLDEAAAVEHFRLQEEPDGAVHLSSLEVHQRRAARFSSRSLALGARAARDEIVVQLQGEGAVVDLAGLYLPVGSQYHDHPVRIEHAAPGATSRQLYKGIVDDAAHGVFNGHVLVQPGADRSDARQVNKNLLLSDAAEVDTRPRLEIFADDVVCTHGAAVGHLDEEALFYLRSRGIPTDRAKSLLTAAFAEEVLDQIPAGRFRALAARRVEQRLGRHGGSPPRPGTVPTPVRVVRA